MLCFLRLGINSRSIVWAVHEFLYCRYYLIDGLTAHLEAHLQDLEENIPLCRVPVISSVEEEQKILSKSNKVIVLNVTEHQVIVLLVSVACDQAIIQ